MLIQEVKRDLENDEAVLIDIREAEEWAQGYVEGATLLSLSQISSLNFPDLPKDKTLYLYCRSGGRVQKAFEILKTSYPRTVPLKFGFMDFVNAGYPITY